MSALKKILNPKILIPVLVGCALLGLVFYILFAPSSWWKPFYVRVDMNDEPTPEPQAQQVAQPAMPQTAIPQSAMPSSVYPGAGQTPPGVMYELDKTVVNLADPGGLRYLQVAIVLEFWPLIEDYYTLSAEEKVVAEDEFKGTIDTWRPKIDDSVMTRLSSKKYNDIASIEGKTQLKQELITDVNEILGYEGVVNIYFTDFLVQ